MGFDYTLRADCEPAVKCSLGRELGAMLLCHAAGYECAAIEAGCGLDLAPLAGALPREPGAGPWRSLDELAAQLAALAAARRDHPAVFDAIEVFVVDPDFFQGRFAETLTGLLSALDEARAAGAERVRVTVY